MRQLLTDYEEIEEVNKQLDTMYAFSWILRVFCEVGIPAANHGVLVFLVD